MSKRKRRTPPPQKETPPRVKEPAVFGEEDPEADRAYWIAEAEKHPPLETADLDNGPDDELLNVGEGDVMTRKEAREHRDEIKRQEEASRPVTLEEAIATLPDYLKPVAFLARMKKAGGSSR